MLKCNASSVDYDEKAKEAAAMSTDDDKPSEEERDKSMAHAQNMFSNI